MLENYRNNLEKVIKSVNAIYSKLTFITVAEILEEEVNLNRIWDKLHNYNMFIHDQYNKAYNWLETLPDDEIGDLDMEIDDLNGIASDKITATQGLIDSMEHILTKEQDEGIKKHFQDIKQRNI